MKGFHIRVVKDGKDVKFEMMDGDYLLREVSAVEIIEMTMQFISALRWR